MSKVAACAFSLAALVGCKASVSADVKTGSSAGDDADGESASFSPDVAPSTSASGDLALYGARHDLAYKGPPSVACECLNIALGQPGDAAFEWATAAPRTDPTTQLVFAMSAASCSKAPEGSPPASYWGYNVSGNDVIVVVENAVEGRPVTTGAIIPKPLGDGQVYVGPLNDKMLYGRGSSGEPRCKAGNPGPRRTSAGAPSEGGTLRIRDSEANQPDM